MGLTWTYDYPLPLPLQKAQNPMRNLVSKYYRHRNRKGNVRYWSRVIPAGGISNRVYLKGRIYYNYK